MLPSQRMITSVKIVGKLIAKPRRKTFVAESFIFFLFWVVILNSVSLLWSTSSRMRRYCDAVLMTMCRITNCFEKVWLICRKRQFREQECKTMPYSTSSRAKLCFKTWCWYLQGKYANMSSGGLIPSPSLTVHLFCNINAYESTSLWIQFWSGFFRTR